MTALLKCHSRVGGCRYGCFLGFCFSQQRQILGSCIC